MRSTLAVALVSFVVLFGAPASAQEAPLSPTILTGFDPLVDGMGFTNRGTFVRPRGTCYGMSLLSIDNYMRRRESGFAPAPHAQITRRPQEGYLIEQVTASAAQDRLSQKTFVGSLDAIGYGEPIAAALRRIESTGEPEVLGFFSPVGGHAIVLTGWSDGALHVYDPNYPGEIMKWPFDPVLGLGVHPEAQGSGGLYDDIDRVTSMPPSTLDPNRELQAIREQCDSGAAACFVGMLPIEDVTHVVDANGDLVVTGRVTGTASDRRVWLVADNQPTGAMAPVLSDGTFEVRLPAGSYEAASHVQVALTAGGKLAGFKDVMNGPPTQQEVVTNDVVQPVREPGRVPTPAGPTVVTPGVRPPAATLGIVGALDRAMGTDRR